MEEREIDLLDMVADILSHWRGLLVAVMIGAFLMGGLSYVKSYRNVKNKSVCKGGGFAFNDGRMFFAEFRRKGCGDGPLCQ